MNRVTVNITFMIDLPVLPPDIPGDPAENEPPTTGAEIVAYDLYGSLIPRLPENVYAVVSDFGVSKVGLELQPDELAASEF